MKGTIHYDGPRLQKLLWWSSDTPDPYDQWQQDTRVATHCLFATRAQKRAFERYCALMKDSRYGMYYDVVKTPGVSFRPQDIQTVFKLYGQKHALGGGPDLVTEMVKLFDDKRTRGGFLWLKTLHKAMKKTGLMK